MHIELPGSRLTRSIDFCRTMASELCLPGFGIEKGLYNIPICLFSSGCTVPAERGIVGLLHNILISTLVFL